MRVLSVVGARPNFMKVAPIVKAMERHPYPFVHRLVHTGQHYDKQMSESFFDDLKMPKPDVNLGIGSGSHAEQTARVMMAIEPVLKEFSPDLVIVVGDVNSTLACALTAKKLNQRVAHVEAGLRSRDMTMPEEINRLCTDAISDDLFVTDRLAAANLKEEGAADERIHFVGNVMIDSLMDHLEAARRLSFADKFGVALHGYGLLTLHRPANVDDRNTLEEILSAIVDGLPGLPILFPVHPRTRGRIIEFGLLDHFSSDPRSPGLHMMDPLGYLEFLSLNGGARIVLTDSGGLQEETTILGIPCVTLRNNTERPITIEEGTNRLGGTSRQGILRAIAEAMEISTSGCRQPEKWDGRAAERIVEVIAIRAHAAISEPSILQAFTFSHNK